MEITRQATGCRLLPGLFLGFFLGLLLAAAAPASGQETAEAADSAGVDAEGTAAGLAGTVHEAETREPLAEALVVLPDQGVGTYSDSTGRFAFADLPAGETVLEVRFLDRRSETRTVTLRPHEVTEVELSLRVRAVEVPGLTVEAERRRRGRMTGFHERKDRGRGHFITREALEKKEGNLLHEVFRPLSGIDAVPCSDLPGARKRRTPACWVLASGREAPSFIQRGPCVPIFYVDGQRTPVDELPLGINELSVDEVEAVEVYTGPAQTPARFSSVAQGRCGAVVIWTRDPDTALQD